MSFMRSPALSAIDEETLLFRDPRTLSYIKASMKFNSPLRIGSCKPPYKVCRDKNRRWLMTKSTQLVVGKYCRCLMDDPVKAG